ncbi:hypothetical protein [Montanilutibacter psychrotolerans]|nr:hypothetical protein [Lysobacter psychrotolerans]
MKHCNRAGSLDALIANLEEPVEVCAEGGNVVGWLFWLWRKYG